MFDTTLARIPKKKFDLHNCHMVEYQPEGKERMIAMLESPHLRKTWDEKETRNDRHKEKIMKAFSNEIEQMKTYVLMYNDKVKGVEIVYSKPRKHDWGRVFDASGCGFTSFRKQVRGTLMRGSYYNFDMKNAHPTILMNVVRRLPDWTEDKYAALVEYVEQRDEKLREGASVLGVSPSDIKELYNSLVYGATIPKWCSKNGLDFKAIKDVIPGHVYRYQTDMKVILNDLKKVNPVLFKFAKDRVDQENREKEMNGDDYLRTPDATFLSFYLQEHEVRIMSVLLSYLNTHTDVLRHPLFPEDKDMMVGQYEFDGCGLLKENVDRFEGGVAGLLRLFETKTAELYGMSLQWGEKPFDSWYDISGFNGCDQSRASFTDYELMKRDFEAQFMYVGSTFIHKNKIGEYTYLKTTEIRNMMKDRHLMVVGEDGKKKKRYFFDMWENDPARKKYDCVDFCIGETGPDVFNLFDGFEMDKWEDDGEEDMTEEKRQSLIAPIIQHLSLLTSGNENWMLTHLARLVQSPGVKTEIGVLLRDESGFLAPGGGTGKNLFFEWFARKFFGDRYVAVIQDNATMYDKFNSIFEGKMLVIVEEASGRDNHANLNSLQAIITSKTLTVNRKGVSQYTVKDYRNSIFFSNDRNCLPIKSGNRRFVVFDTDKSKKGNAEYFARLIEAMDDPAVVRAFYHHLKAIDISKMSNIEMVKQCQESETYRELQLLNAPMHVKWVLWLTENGQLESMQEREVSLMYKHFTNWVTGNREGKEEAIMSQTAFGTYLSREKGIGEKKKNTKGCMVFRWNIAGVVECLKIHKLIGNGFQYQYKPIIAVDDETASRSAPLSHSPPLSD